MSLDENEEHSNLFQRMTFYSVPIPGENEWVKNVRLNINPLLNAS